MMSFRTSNTDTSTIRALSPSDFSTMGRKVENHEYNSIEEFQVDASLIWENCMVCGVCVGGWVIWACVGVWV